MAQRSHVPLLSVNGRFLGLRSVEAIRRLADAGRVACVRSRGIIAYATLVDNTPAPCGPPTPDACRSRDGQRYVYREQLQGGESVYDLKRLDGRRNGLRYALLRGDVLNAALLRMLGQGAIQSETVELTPR